MAPFLEKNTEGGTSQNAQGLETIAVLGLYSPPCLLLTSLWGVSRGWESLKRGFSRPSPSSNSSRKQLPELPTHRPILIQDQGPMAGVWKLSRVSLLSIFFRFLSALRSPLKGKLITSLLGSKTSNVYHSPDQAEHPVCTQASWWASLSLNLPSSPSAPTPSVSPWTPTALLYPCSCMCMPGMLSFFSLLVRGKRDSSFQENTSAEAC